MWVVGREGVSPVVTKKNWLLSFLIDKKLLSVWGWGDHIIPPMQVGIGKGDTLNGRGSFLYSRDLT